MAALDTPQLQQTLKGIGWMVLTGMLFAGVTAIVRYLGSDMPAIEAAFIRYLIGLIMILPFLYSAFKSTSYKTNLKLYAVRGLVHGVAVILWFYAMARIPMAEVTAIGYTAPIFVTIGAALFLGERLHVHRIMAVVVGLVGVFIIIRPGFQEVGLGQLAQLSAAPLFAVSFILAKQFTGRSSPMEIVAMLSLFCTIVLLPGALLQWREPTLEEIFWLTITALFATVGHYTLTKAFASAPITVTQPISYLQLVWAVLLGVLLFGETVDPFVLLGGAIIVCAITYISHRELRLARKPITPSVSATKV